MPAKQMLTVLTFGYDASYIVDPKDVSAILTILAKSQRVADRWIDGYDGTCWVKKEGEHVTLRQSMALPPLTEEAYTELRDAADERRRLREEEEEEEEEARAVTGDAD